MIFSQAYQVETGSLQTELPLSLLPEQGQASLLQLVEQRQQRLVLHVLLGQDGPEIGPANIKPYNNSLSSSLSPVEILGLGGVDCFVMIGFL